MTSLARVSTGLRLNRNETSRISIPFLVRFPPGSCSGVQRKIDTRIGQDARILSKIRFTTNVPFYYDPLYRCSLQVQRSLPGSLKNVSLCCCNLFSTLLFYFILTSFKNFTIFRCIHIRIYLSIYIGYLSPENLWVSSRCSMFLDPNVSYFFFFLCSDRVETSYYFVRRAIYFSALSSRVILQLQISIDLGWNVECDSNRRNC